MHPTLKSTLFAAPAVLLAGCGVGGPAFDPDTDSDGLSDSFEESIGTNPESADSDGDGFADADEYLSFFDPGEAGDFPRAGDYPRQPLPAEITSEGTEIGNVVPDWALEDQFGETISLHEFYGNVVLIGIGAVW